MHKLMRTNTIHPNCFSYRESLGNFRYRELLGNFRYRESLGNFRYRESLGYENHKNLPISSPQRIKNSDPNNNYVEKILRWLAPNKYPEKPANKQGSQLEEKPQEELLPENQSQQKVLEG